MKPDPQLIKIVESLSVAVTADLAEQLQTFKNELLRANEKINLVSRQNSAAVIDRLIADSLAIADCITPPPGAKLLDIGSGAGFPWIPIKLVHREIIVASVDTNRRKIEFQRSVARLLQLNNCEFYAERVQSLVAQSADMAVAKAVSDVASLLEWAAPHLKSGGSLILPRSVKDQFADGSLSFGWELAEERAYGTAIERDSGKLLIFRKL